MHSGVLPAMSRTLTYLIALLCVGASACLDNQSERVKAQGTQVLLGRTCNEQDGFDNRTITVRILPDATYFLNSQPESEASLRQHVSRVMDYRIERILWVAADKRMTYGEVAGVISKLQSDTPRLRVALATESQIGPVDPTEIKRMRGKMPDGRYIGMMPCVSSDIRL